MLDSKPTSLLLPKTLLSLIVSLLILRDTLAQCPSRINTKHYRGYCYSYYNLPKTWSEANEACAASSNSTLMRLESYWYWSYLKPWVNGRTVWTSGFTKNFTGNSSNFQLETNATWFWTNSSSPGLIAEAKGIASIGWYNYTADTATGSCLAIRNSSWNPRNCLDRLPYVCQYGPCVQHITSKSPTVIKSVYYPSYYPPNVICEWFIDVEEGVAILKFQNFRLEADCTYDKVVVYEKKVNGTNRPLATLCGSYTPNIIRSPSRYMYIYFKTDGSDQYSGFRGTVQSSTAPTVSALRTSHGIINSPNFPGYYLNNTRHAWLIDVGEGWINLQFTDFDLQPGNGTQCTYDYVKIQEGSIAGPVLGTYCGGALPNKTVSRTGTLYITFGSDNFTEKSGFRAIYWSSEETCLQVINEGGITIQTPRYPLTYRGQTCTWYINVGEGAAKINFEDIRSAVSSAYYSATSSCTISRLQVFNGQLPASGSPTLLRSYCGTATRYNQTSPSRYITVQYSSMSSTYSYSVARKFKAHVRSTANCSETISQHSGVVTSPDYPSYYDPYANCTWKIDVRMGNATIRFADFSIERHSTCSKDKLEIFDGNSTGDRRFGPYCGSNSPGLIVASGRYLTLRLTSDSRSTAKGFKAEFYSSELPCMMWGVSDMVTRRINNTCYGLMKQQKSWSSARSFCEGRNSSLIRFNNRAEFNSIRQWLYQFLRIGSSGTWTSGYRRLANSTKWFWSTLNNGDIPFKADLTATLWGPGDPAAGLYVYMDNGGLHDVTGLYSNRYYTLCEEHTNQPTPQERIGGCTAPPNIRSGFYSPPDSYYFDGENITFSCDEYLILVGNPTLTCANGGWSNHVPHCQAISDTTAEPSPTSTLPASCFPPASISQGKFEPEANMYEHGSKLRVVCSRGYEIISNQSIECSFGRWQGTLPYCSKQTTTSSTTTSTTTTTTTTTTERAKKRCAPPTLTNTMHEKFDPLKDFYNDGELVYGQCEGRKNTSKNNQQIICSNGVWITSYPFIPCPSADKGPTHSNTGVLDKGPPHSNTGAVQDSKEPKSSNEKLLAGFIPTVIILMLVIIAGVTWQILKKRRRRKTNLLLEMME